MIPALVLTAGLATRLRPLSLVRAKAALPVAGQPLVRRILEQLRSAGVSDAVLNLHHLPHTITGLVGDGSDLDMRVRYSWERPILGSAGGPRLALPLLDGSTFLIANGDTLADVDIPSLVADHRRSGALVTLAVTTSPDPKKYGGIVADADGSMTGFTTAGSTEASWHFIGLQVAESDAFASVEAGAPCESVRVLYPALIAARPGSVRVHACAAEFFDIGTPDDYRHTSRLLAQREERVALHGLRTRIDPTARVDDSILWDDVEVGARSILRGCIVTDGVRVPDDASWTGVSVRRAVGELEPGERRVGDLAVGSI
jgi:NDP-sugar pyrophosphorylase family protein